MQVVSLFDGISCARVALDRANLPVKTYFACEIDPHAIAISTKNYPDIVRLGDVRSLTEWDTPVDLLIGGSPCQDLSIAKKNRQGLAGDRSGLFWEYVRIRTLLKPRYFILENVASMPQADRDIITEALGVEPILINAALVSAQSRRRLFWTNLPTSQPADRGILLKDILQPESEVDPSMFVKEQTSFTATAQTGRNETKKLGHVTENDHQANRVYDDTGKLPALASVCNSMVKVGYIGTGEQYGQGGQAHRVYDPDGKTPTLSSTSPLVKVEHSGTISHVGHLAGGVRKGMEEQTHLSRAHRQTHRVYGADGKAPTLSASETSGRVHVKVGWSPSPYPVHVPDGSSTQPIRVGHEQRRKLRDGKRADDDPTIEAVRRIETRNDDKSGTLTTVLKDNTVVDVQTHRIRKLTPVECERLQGLPDDYTATVAKTHRYKCLGNAFNVDVIAHLLKSYS